MAINFLGTWKINSFLEDVRMIGIYNITFKSNNKTFNKLEIRATYDDDEGYNNMDLYYDDTYIANYWIYSGETWENEAYRTITITDVSNLTDSEGLESFLNIYATKTAELENPKAISLENLQQFKAKCDETYEKKGGSSSGGGYKLECQLTNGANIQYIDINGKSANFSGNGIIDDIVLITEINGPFGPINNFNIESSNGGVNYICVVNNLLETDFKMRVLSTTDLPILPLVNVKITADGNQGGGSSGDK